MDKPERLVIYTVLLGDKEALGSPLSLLENKLETDLDIEFICFTDNKDLKSDVWKFIYFDDAHLPIEKLSRRPKTLPHEYLSQWSYSLYVDNIVVFKRLPNQHDLLTNKAYLFKAFHHAYRENLYQESDAIAMLGYDDVNIIGKQINFYAKSGSIESIKPIHTCTVIFREHNHPDVIKHGTIWWENILCFSKRDQMSFDYAIKSSGCTIEALPGYKHDNDLMEGINNAHDNRVKANFDETKYSWLNRHIPEAKENPRAHFLSDSEATGEDYAKKTHLFEHICYRYKSSLGQSIAPRRTIAGTFDEILTPFKAKNVNCLLARILETKSPHEFLEEEFSPAVQSIATFLNPCITNTFEVRVDELENTDICFNRTEDLFDIMILVGLPAKNLEQAFKKFTGLLNPKQGMLTFLLNESIDIAVVSEVQQMIKKRFLVNCQVFVSYSRHDSCYQVISNSLIYFKWGF